MKGLLVEDHSATCGQLVETLPRAGLEIYPAPDPTTAMAMVKQGTYDVALIDLMLDPNDMKELGKPTYNGIHLGANIRAMDASILIIMYSANIDIHRENKFSHYNECLDSGADKVVSREYIISSAPNNFVSALLSWKQEKNESQRTGFSMQVADNFSTKAVVEKVGGKNILTDIIRHTLSGYDSYEVGALSGGYSGSIVLRVVSKNIDNSGNGARNIVKISASPYSLNDELRRRPFEGSVLDGYATLPRADNPVKVENWYAFGLREVNDAHSLEDFLLKRQLNSQNRTALRKVVKHLLLEPAINSRPIKIDELGNSLSLRYSFLAAIEEALLELTEYCNSYRKESMPALDKLNLYLDGCDSGYYPFSTNNHRVATLHGDMHCRNILFNDAKQPVLIDFGRADTYPRLFDFACLEVDLLIRVKDMNSAHHWDPKRINNWLKISEEGYPFTQKDPPPTDCISFLRFEIHKTIREEIPYVSEREYAEALIFQLFRYIRFQNIPIFKKVVCAEMLSHLISMLFR